MAILQLKAHFSSGETSQNEGSTIPAWFDSNLAAFASKTADVNNWWGKNTGLEYFYSVNGNSAYIQHGSYSPGYVSASFISETVIISNEVLHSNGYVTADISITLGNLAGKPNPNASTGRGVTTKIVVHGTTVFTRTGTTVDSYTSEPNPKTVTFSVNIPPASYDDSSSIYRENVYTDTGQSTSASIGLTLYNPTPPTYVPMSERKNGTWKNLNDNSGKIKIRNSGTWVDRSQEMAETSMQPNKGHNRIRRSGTWLQLPKMS